MHMYYGLPIVEKFYLFRLFLREFYVFYHQNRAGKHTQRKRQQKAICHSAKTFVDLLGLCAHIPPQTRNRMRFVFVFWWIFKNSTK